MKRKRSTYVLAALAAAIWAVIFIRIFSSKASEENKLRGNRDFFKEEFNDYSLIDTTALRLNYPDPFRLSAIRSEPDQQPDVYASSSLSDPVKIPEPDWSAITYSGYIRNPGSKKLLAMLNLKGKNVLMAEGETRDDIKLIKNLRDSIKVSQMGKTRFISIYNPQ
ncbi:hypothetical protein [Desertivirga xinjiangensis]|uniref:hypothetical protein n=1 Tax=Desertivirga xinjiangensis TaxID=539206 RepID=UPI0021088DEF|nr:hypothetical protein [Pedobacter xinjiangensis]